MADVEQAQDIGAHGPAVNLAVTVARGMAGRGADVGPSVVSVLIARIDHLEAHASESIPLAVLREHVYNQGFCSCGSGLGWGTSAEEITHREAYLHHLVEAARDQAPVSPAAKSEEPG